MTHASPSPRPSIAKLVEDHLPLVRAIAFQLIRNGQVRFIEPDELVSLGSVALVEAAGRFDPTAGTRFATYAYQRIRGAMLDGVGQHAPVKRSVYRSIRRVGDGTVGSLFIASLDEMLDRGLEVADRKLDPVDALDQQRERRAVAEAVAALPARKRRFVVGHYAEERELKEIGEELGLSRSWASRLHAQALAELRSTLGAREAA
jgi:RNA polymerase sigma factor FliA